MYNSKPAVHHIEPEYGMSEEAAGGYGEPLSFKELLGVLRRRMLVIVLVSLLMTGIAVGLSMMLPPVYQADAEILVGMSQKSNAVNSLAGDVQGLQGVTQTVAAAIPSRSIAREVIDKMNLRTTPEAFLNGLSVQQISSTQLIDISYRTSNPVLARDIVNTVAQVSSDKIAQISPQAGDITATIWEPASKPQAPVSPNPVRNGALALVIGLMLGVGLAFVLEYLDDSWRSPEEVERVSGVPTFGIIPNYKVPKALKKGAR
ncbi:MAG: hypothetical protein K6T51_08275 [Rubrobacteraceae bacterium]|nr:hypothetical protein [Rubrobacteraceae bacterium]MCL6438595.1 hypothetical protein [Rubrobacteraceae bacterium]